MNPRNLILLLTLATASLAPFTASAHGCHFAPSVEDTTIDPVVVDAGACELVLPLALTKFWKRYPLLDDHGFVVEAWTGVYRKTVTTRERVRRDVYDGCTGALLSSRIVEGESCTRPLEFEIDNPNLHDDVKASYELVPMTDDEAKAALQSQLALCQTTSSPTALAITPAQEKP